MTEILPNAIKYRTFNGGGAGGQHQNRTESAVEVSLADFAADHLGIPRGLKATANGRSQLSSKRLAVNELKARVRAALKMNLARGRNTAGTGRVRTYHAPDNRVTDTSGMRSSYRATVGKGDIAPLVDGRREALVRGES